MFVTAKVVQVASHAPTASNDYRTYHCLVQNLIHESRQHQPLRQLAVCDWQLMWLNIALLMFAQQPFWEP